MSTANRWRVMQGIDPVAAESFADLDRVFTLEGQIVAQDSMSNVIRVSINAHTYYVKRYAGLGHKPLRRLFATPRIQLEWENLQHFVAWGIPTADLVAYGLEKKWGRFVRGAMITAEIKDTQDLRRLARNKDPRLQSRHWWDGVSHQLAEITRRMHEHRFAHGDLKWRNLLVDKNNRLYLIDCPSGGFWHPPLLEYRIIKDLACIDKLAKRNLSRNQRLRFYLDYAGKQRVDESDTKRIRQIIDFFLGRDEELATAASLRKEGRTPLPRQNLALANGQLLEIKRWLRVLPGKRLTGAGEWQGRPVLAKLFIAEHGADRHFEREFRGAQMLVSHSLPTPALLASGQIENGGLFILYEFLADARPPTTSSSKEMAMVFAEVGQMHSRGLIQQDTHLSNFLLQENRLLIIDGDAIQPSISNSKHEDNLALLLAQLPPEREAELHQEMIDAYCKGKPDAALEATRLAATVDRHRQARLKDYLDKCLRDCSTFKVIRRSDRYLSVLRSEARHLAPLLNDPDAWLEKGTPLKRGETATLARIEINGQQLVIKRYNIKNSMHALSRLWRPSRAWHAWLEGHRLGLLGIPTPRPLALIEQRVGPMRGKAWLITEYCPGELLSAQFSSVLDNPPENTVRALGGLFKQLVAQRICHGDLKATNLLLQNSQISLIDLDSTRQYTSEAAFSRAWCQDRERLLRNWPATSALHSAIDKALPPATSPGFGSKS